MTKKKLFLCYMIWLILFWGIRWLLSLFTIEYRSWISVPGHVISVVTPFVLLGWLLLTKKIHPAFHSIYIILACVILFIAGLVGLLRMRTEHTSKTGQFQLYYPRFLDSGYDYDYEKISFWGRRPIYGLEEVKLLEEKYGCKFTVDRDRRSLDLGWIRYRSEVYPKLWIEAYIVGEGEIRDNYSELYVTSIWTKMYHEYEMQTERGYSSFPGPMNHLISDWDKATGNLTLLSEEAAMLIAHTIETMEQDVNAPCRSGAIFISIKHQQEYYKFYLPFGDSEILMEEGKARDYYASAENIHEMLLTLVAGGGADE